MHPVVERIADRQPQSAMANSTRQHGNVVGAFTVRTPLPMGPVLLIDDTVDSRWTLTEVGGLLRDAGCPAVHPLAVADGGAS